LRKEATNVDRYISCAAAILTLACSSLAAAQAAAPTITRAMLVGMYDGGQMEVGAQLVLKADGHFGYELAYGALDESATGTWEFKDGAVFLTTVPAVVPPRFVVESDKPDPRGGLWLKLSNGPLMEGANQRVYLIYGPKDQPDMVEVAEDGHVPFPGDRRPTAFLLEIPVYPVQGQPIPLTGTGGHLITVRFEANGIGKADFRAMKLSIEDGVLVMPRRDLELILHFRPQGSHTAK
jgi:hypothetical protein